MKPHGEGRSIWSGHIIVGIDMVPAHRGGPSEARQGNELTPLGHCMPSATVRGVCHVQQRGGQLGSSPICSYAILSRDIRVLVHVGAHRGGAQWSTNTGWQETGSHGQTALPAAKGKGYVQAKKFVLDIACKRRGLPGLGVSSKELW